MTCWLCGFKTTDSELVTNATPTCKTTSCQICIEVAKVDEEINQAAAALRRLIAKRCDLRSEQNRAHDPVGRLPVELKNHIFELLLPLRDEWGRIGTRRAGEAILMPSFLASVSRGWRDIAWSNPFLWSTMHIAMGASRLTTDPSGLINFVRDWILRSGTLLLTFYMHVVEHTSTGFERPREVLAALLDAMSQFSNRLQSLSLNIPYPLLQAFQDLDSNFQWHRLTRLRIRSLSHSSAEVNQALPVLNLTARPEKIKLSHLSFQSLQISWNHLKTATVRSSKLGDVTQLFQHASQMTECRIFTLEHDASSFSMSSIFHPRLKTLRIGLADRGVGLILLLGSLTLPCLQEFETKCLVVLPLLHALVHRSSCPLTRLTLSDYFSDRLDLFKHLQPLPGVTDVVVEALLSGEPAVFKRLLLEGYYPDLRHLTLRLQPFLVLWEAGVIPLLLDRRPDGLNEGRLLVRVIDHDKAAEFDRMWNSNVGEQLEALNISPKKDGFEIL